MHFVCCEWALVQIVINKQCFFIVNVNFFKLFQEEKSQGIVISVLSLSVGFLFDCKISWVVTNECLQGSACKF